MHLFVVAGQMLGEGDPGWPYQWDGFGEGGAQVCLRHLAPPAPGADLARACRRSGAASRCAPATDTRGALQGKPSQSSLYPVGDGTPHAKHQDTWVPTFSTMGRRAGGGFLVRPGPCLAAPPPACVRARLLISFLMPRTVQPPENDWEHTWKVSSQNPFGGPGDNLNKNPLAHI